MIRIDYSVVADVQEGHAVNLVDAFGREVQVSGAGVAAGLGPGCLACGEGVRIRFGDFGL